MQGWIISDNDGKSICSVDLVEDGDFRDEDAHKIDINIGIQYPPR